MGKAVWRLADSAAARGRIVSRPWKPGSHEQAEPSGAASYNPVPMLVLLSEEMGDPKYQQSAIKAADYVWTNFGSRGLFIGGAIDNPNITDKEAGMLSMEAIPHGRLEGHHRGSSALLATKRGFGKRSLISPSSEISNYLAHGD